MDRAFVTAEAVQSQGEAQPLAPVFTKPQVVGAGRKVRTNRSRASVPQMLAIDLKGCHGDVQHGNALDERGKRVPLGIHVLRPDWNYR